ncbi:MAG: PocR ligand-binding domain-containing protein [Eubacteriales bacterium]|nr:PocR ligand-binding domain-containing protein [Eubacteriales bacterium]
MQVQSQSQPSDKLDLERAKRAVEHYSRACGVSCRVINTLGDTLNTVHAKGVVDSICDFAQDAGHSEISVCDKTHLYGCYQSERFGGQYIYFCPLGLTHWASPIVIEDIVVGALVGGPVNLIEPDGMTFDDFANKFASHHDGFDEIRKNNHAIPVFSPTQVNSFSELLYCVASSLSDKSFSRIEQKNRSNKLQSELWEQISILKKYNCQDEVIQYYPIQKEQNLIEMIENGDKQSAQACLNEILGHIFFSNGGNIEVMRARIIELVVLLSRAAIRGGADIEQIFGQNYTYLNKVQSLRNIDEIAYWLSAILTRLTDQVFNLTDIKHADVIYRAVAYVKKNYSKKITLEETAEYVYLSPAYFSRVFKDEMGINFNSYINQIRVDAAKKLLLHDDELIIDISTLVGFEGQSYFTKVFKKMTKVTPSRFRESRGKMSSQTTAN